MNPKANFFICSCVIFTFAVINLHIGPTITKKITSYSIENCKILSDELDDMKTKPQQYTELQIENQEKQIRKCRNRKAMSVMEYIVFIINMGIGFICLILGLNAVQKEMIPKTGLIGITFGAIGFILTFIYLIFNGIVYTNYYDDNIYKIDEDAAYAKLEGDKYKCIYFNGINDEEALYAKFSDLIKSQYNYNKKLITAYKDQNYELGGCQKSKPSKCLDNGYIEGPYNGQPYTYNNGQICTKLYYYKDIYKDYGNYINYARSAQYLACLILTLFTVLCHCGLAFCGYMLFKES